MSLSGARADAARAGFADGREFAFTAEDFRQIADLVHSSTGIILAEYKSAMVYSRLAKRLRALGLESFREYCRLVLDNRGLDERQKMLAALTTNMTSFFREPHHFDHLKQTVLPPLLEAARRGGRVRIWSAACSSGEEPYSIALTILSLLPDAPSLDVKVLATDINPSMIEKGRDGVYPEKALASVAADLKKRWFAPAASVDGEPCLTATEPLRSLVVFRELNLIGEWPMRGLFQAIFCRNVVIYFEEATRDKILERFVPKLVPGGWLYMGHSERLGAGVASRFTQDGFTTFRLIAGRNSL
jgi:chemotaxis protein methyltransferase CheR